MSRRPLSALLLAALMFVAARPAATEPPEWGVQPAGRYDPMPSNAAPLGSEPANAAPDSRDSRYNGGGGMVSSASPGASGAANALRPSGGSTPSQMAPVGSNGPRRARVSQGKAQLPNDSGQVWREYDIRPYTLRAEGAAKPQQAIVDWVLRETGYDAWHSETFGVLHASSETLTVYHTPDMQAIVADIVDRFVKQHPGPDEKKRRALEWLESLKADDAA